MTVQSGMHLSVTSDSFEETRSPRARVSRLRLTEAKSGLTVGGTFCPAVSVAGQGSRGGVRHAGGGPWRGTVSVEE
jgi:hypothetical protein